MTDHWKNYAPIDGVLVFDEASGQPSTGVVQVLANVSPNPAYPTCRVILGIGGHISGSFTVEQIRALREVLEHAERDVTTILTATGATGAEGRCETCSRAIRAGELVHVYDDAAVHAGACPGKEHSDG